MIAWADLQQVQWRAPWALLVLLIPLALAWLGRHRARRMAGYADPQLRPWTFAGEGGNQAAKSRRLAEAAAWLLLALAAAGPRLPLETPVQPAAGERPPHRIDVMVVLDVSGSMLATDLAPDRLARARLELADWLRRLHGERLGLVVHAGQAGVLLPPTGDLALFARALQQATPDLLEDAPGNDVARALELARGSLAKPSGDRRSRAVLLVTDAEASSLDGAAASEVERAVQALRAAGIPLYLLVTASEAGTQLSLAGQVAAASRPDLASWRRLAHATGGALALASAGDGDWRALHDEGMARLPGEPVEAAAAQAWRELHGWPLALALPLLLWGLLPTGAGRAIASASLLVVLLPLLFTPSPAQAEEASMQAARAYRAGRWAEALPQFQRQGGYAGHMGAGAAAWRLREFALAQQHFSQALLLAPGPAQRDDALYNLGNAAYAQGRWQAAAQAWRSVLASRPGDARARANLALAEAQLARRAQAPGGATDLRGRRGTTLEGRVGIEGGGDVREDAALAQQQAPATEAAAAGARLEGNDALPADSAAAIDPRLLQSGRLKMERIEDHQRAMLRGLLRQDRVADRPAPVHPW